MVYVLYMIYYISSNGLVRLGEVMWFWGFLV